MAMSILDIPCPDCGNETPRRLHELKRNPSFTCSACGRRVTVRAGEVQRALNSADYATENGRHGMASR